MAKVAIIRNFLTANRGELPPSREAVGEYIDNISASLNFQLTRREKTELLTEFAPESEKKPSRGIKTETTTEPSPEEQ